jgi:hypothetical protein
MIPEHLIDSLWGVVEPMGWTRHGGIGLPQPVQFYAPGVEDGYIEVGPGLHGTQVVIEIGAESEWAYGLRALAALLEGREP